MTLSTRLISVSMNGHQGPLIKQLYGRRMSLRGMRCSVPTFKIGVPSIRLLSQRFERSYMSERGAYYLYCYMFTIEYLGFNSRNAGVITEVKVKQNLVGEAMDRARAELDGRTGETDSEMEDIQPDEPEEGQTIYD